jgi:hypothetical protein
VAASDLQGRTYRSNTLKIEGFGFTIKDMIKSFVKDLAGIATGCGNPIIIDGNPRSEWGII